MVKRLPVAGTPFKALKPVITVATPAVTASWKGGQVHFAKLAFGDEGGVVVPAGFGGAVAYEMLGAGGQGGLETAHHGGPRGRRRGKDLRRGSRQRGPSADRARCRAWGRRSNECLPRTPRAQPRRRPAPPVPDPTRRLVRAEWETPCGSRGSRRAPNSSGMPRRLSLTAMRWASARSSGLPALRKGAPPARADLLFDLVRDGRAHGGGLRHLPEFLFERHSRE